MRAAVVLRGSSAPSRPTKRQRCDAQHIVAVSSEASHADRRRAERQITATGHVISISPLRDSDQRKHEFLWHPCDCVEWHLGDVHRFPAVEIPHGACKQGTCFARHFKDGEMMDPCLRGARIGIMLPRLQYKLFSSQHRT
eukprot:5869126-Pyramimonas_sp.AAC.2